MTTAVTTPGRHAAPPVFDGPAPVTGNRLRWVLSDCWVMVRRNLTHIPRVPEKLAGATIQPIAFVLLFAYVFGSAIAVPGGVSYQEFLLPGIFVQTVTLTAVATAVGLATDMRKGLVDRFRSLPMSRSAVLFGRTMGDFVERTISVIGMVICGLLIGWQIRGGFLAAVGGFAVLLLFAYAMNWFGALVGLVIKDPEAVSTLGLLVLMPLTFVTNAFVPTDGMPYWMRLLAEWNPASAVVSALRELFGNAQPVLDGAWPMQHPVLAAVGWSLLILVLSWVFAVRRYRSAT